jgi:hypothetical protein
MTMSVITSGTSSKEGAVQGAPLATGHHLSALLHCVGNVRLDLLDFAPISGTMTAPGSKRSAPHLRTL